MQLSAFNAAPDAEAARTVAAFAAVPDWVDAVVAGRPYDSVDELAQRAALLSQEWDADDLAAALAHHPRIGERPAGAGAEADHSRTEQAAMSAASDDLSEAMATANAAYEARFGRVFLIRAAGRSAEEMLAEARRRVGNDAVTETDEALTQLREIALLRLRATLVDDDDDEERT
ncbi:2-oxo-4-hydroxy-4-carboxy-5-ureidoimidazoline decarboxylase [Microbacterium sp. NPDC080220]|uniref:2-oxo-4-hydroxy-4-carboxy-5-ureidoimidazoline decarboxylase n=1 Tax=Microbacterium sp. NPDC080220 TaxID=3161017 RepID=UPI00343F77ED